MNTDEKRRHLMIETQLRTNKVTDTALLEAFGRIPREVFAGPDRAELAYIDEDLEIGEGRFLVEPMVLARLVQALELESGDSVLDIGAASGYSTAILAQLAQSVVGIEGAPGIAGAAQGHLAALDIDNAVVLEGEMTAGFREEAPYNAIIIEGAVEEVPAAILDQLGAGGRLVTVLKPKPSAQGRAVRFTRAGAKFETADLFDANTPLLDGFNRRPAFEFAS